MPRIARNNLNGNFFHIVVQGLNKEYIFSEEKYIYKYRNIMFEKLKKVDITILGYCVMSNHVHILIFSEKISEISKYMQLVNTTYSNFYNKQEKRVGYVFKDRFYSQEILNKKHLYNCLKYIHNNPVKSGICKNMSEYLYSSYNEFLIKRYIITSKSIKLLFNNNDYIKSFYELHKCTYDEIEIFDVKEMDIETFIRKVEEENQLKLENLKNNKVLLKRVIKDARKYTDVTLEELAQILGVSKSTIGNYNKK